jgi:hypothetical protein
MTTRRPSSLPAHVRAAQKLLALRADVTLTQSLACEVLDAPSGVDGVSRERLVQMLDDRELELAEWNAWGRDLANAMPPPPSRDAKRRSRLDWPTFLRGGGKRLRDHLDVKLRAWKVKP